MSSAVVWQPAVEAKIMYPPGSRGLHFSNQEKPFLAQCGSCCTCCPLDPGIQSSQVETAPSEAADQLHLIGVLSAPDAGDNLGTIEGVDPRQFEQCNQSAKNC